MEEVEQSYAGAGPWFMANFKHHDPPYLAPNSLACLHPLCLPLNLPVEFLRSLALVNCGLQM